MPPEGLVEDSRRSRGGGPRGSLVREHGLPDEEAGIADGPGNDVVAQGKRESKYGSGDDAGHHDAARAQVRQTQSRILGRKFEVDTGAMPVATFAHLEEALSPEKRCRNHECGSCKNVFNFRRNTVLPKPQAPRVCSRRQQHCGRGLTRPALAVSVWSVCVGSGAQRGAGASGPCGGCQGRRP